MTEEDVLKAKKLVQKFHMVFLKNDLDLGKTDKVKYTIKITDTPLHSRKDTEGYHLVSMMQ